MTNGGGIQVVTDGDTALAYVVRKDVVPSETTFVTPDALNLQMGFIVYSAGTEIARHRHLPLERHLVGTSEVLVVRRGRCIVDVYNPARVPVASVELTQGDIVMFIAGGHGFRMIEDTVLMEVKQGPYLGVAEKERF